MVPVPRRRRDQHHEREHDDERAFDLPRRTAGRDHDERDEQPDGQGRVAHEAELGIQHQPDRLADPHRVRPRRLVRGEVRRAELARRRRGARRARAGRRAPRPRFVRATRARARPRGAAEGLEQREQGERRVLDGGHGGTQRGRPARAARPGHQGERRHRERQHLRMRPEQEAEHRATRGGGRPPRVGPTPRRARRRAPPPSAAPRTHGVRQRARLQHVPAHDAQSQRAGSVSSG